MIFLFMQNPNGKLKHLSIKKALILYSFLPTETIIQKGKYPLGVYLLLEGQVFITGGPLQKSFRKLNQGSYFGETCLMSDHCSLHSYM